MAYCTQSDILEQIDSDLLIQLTDDADAGEVDAGAVTRAIADADAEIDAYAGARYDVPFATVPALVRKWSAEIAIYNLYARRMGATDDRKERYQIVLAALRALSKGLLSLGASAPDASDDSGPEASTVAADRVFTLGRDSSGTTGTLDRY